MNSAKDKDSIKKEKRVEPKQTDEIKSVRMNINISKSFYKQIKQQALDEDTTITELVLKALKRYLSKQ